MKFLYFLLLIISLPVLLIGQNIEFDEESGLYAQVEVLEFENRTKDDLFDKTIEWVTLNYNSANDVVQLNDKEAGKLIVKGIVVLPASMGRTLNINHTLTFEFKENRMRYRYTGFSGFYLDYNGNAGSSSSFESEIWKKNNSTLKKLDGHIKATEIVLNQYIRSLIEFIEADDSDDW